MPVRYLLALFFVLLIVAVWSLKFQNVFRQAATIGRFRTNLVWVTGEKVKLVSIDRDQMLVFSVPEKMMVPVVGMSSDLKAGSLKKFADSEKQPLMVIRRSMEVFFGSVIDGVVESDKGHKSALDMVKGDLLAIQSVTDLSLLQRLVLVWSVKSLRDGQVKSIEIPLELGEAETLPDGSEIVNVNRTRLNLVVDEGLINDNLRSDPARVVIENASGENNMGVLAEKMIKSAGGFVIEVKSGPTVDGWCHFGAGKETREENKALVEWLTDRFACIADSKINPENDQEIKVVIGRGFGETYR